MTRPSRRELEKAVEELTDSDAGPGTIVVDREVVDENGEVETTRTKVVDLRDGWTFIDGDEAPDRDPDATVDGWGIYQEDPDT